MSPPGRTQADAFSVLRRTTLDREIAEFLLDREARGLSPRTLTFYRDKLRALRAYLADTPTICDVTATQLRAWLVQLAKTHNPGGVKQHFQVMRTLFRWYELEYQPRDWRNPVVRIAAPKVPERHLLPVSLADVRAMLDTCQRRTIIGDRDRALLLFLLDTGLRRAEVVALNLGDLNVSGGLVTVRHGKGDRMRVVPVSARVRKAVMVYLRWRRLATDGDPLFATDEWGRLSLHGLWEIVRRRARSAGIRNPGLHAFRRAFASYSLDNDADLVSIQAMLGHADLTTTRLYITRRNDALRAVHDRTSPAAQL